MSPSRAGLILAKELRETLRDRRTLTVMIAVPILLYPLLIVGVNHLTLIGRARLEREPAGVAVSGAQGDRTLDAALQGAPGIELRRSTAPRSDLEAGRLQVVVEAPPGIADSLASGAAVPVTVLYDRAEERSRIGESKVTEALEELSDSLLTRRLRATGLPPQFARPLRMRSVDIAPPEKMGGFLMGKVLPMVLVLMTLLGAFYPAIDLTAGEKERGTLETILASPATRGEIMVGKFGAVLAISLTTALLNLGSMLLTFAHGLLETGLPGRIAFALPRNSAFVIVAALAILSLLFSALLLSIAVFARSFKEAQNYLTPVYLLALLPAMAPILPGLALRGAMTVAPIANVALLFRDLLTGPVPPSVILAVLSSSLLYAALAIRLSASLFGREEVLLGEGLPPFRRRLGRPGERLPRPLEAMVLFAATLLLLFYVGTRLQGQDLFRGLLLTELLLILLPVVVWAAVRGWHPARTFRLRAPGPRTLAGSLLMAVGGVLLVGEIAVIQDTILPVPRAYLEALRAAYTVPPGESLLRAFAIVAIAPALCEETLFRGAILRGLEARLRPGAAIAVTGLLFGVFHLNPYRLLPTAIIGSILAYIVWRTESLPAGIVYHAANNAAALAALNWGPLQGIAWLQEEGHVPAPLLLMAACAFGGGWLLLPRHQVPSPAGGSDAR